MPSISDGQTLRGDCGFNGKDAIYAFRKPLISLFDDPVETSYKICDGHLNHLLLYVATTAAASHREMRISQFYTMRSDISS